MQLKMMYLPLESCCGSGNLFFFPSESCCDGRKEEGRVCLVKRPPYAFFPSPFTYHGIGTALTNQLGIGECFPPPRPFISWPEAVIVFLARFSRFLVFSLVLAAIPSSGLTLGPSSFPSVARSFLIHALPQPNYLTFTSHHLQVGRGCRASEASRCPSPPSLR